MKIRNFVAIALLVASSFAANSVAPSTTELEAMYDKAFRAFDANNYTEALKDLEAIDARQPDLAESQNLRGVIMMRQKEYDKAETALRKALAADPKFWNARFNLAEIPFLQKKWPEARKRFQELLTGNASELQGEATQLIQYKIFLTYLLEGKESMATSLMAKFELAPDAPAVHFANAAVALNKSDENDAKEWLTKAEKNFSPQLNKLFAESLYEVGWLEKPPGETRAALELNSAADRAAQTKALAEAKYDEAEQALAQRDFTAARKLVDDADSADPNQPRIVNLRGEILMQQQDFDAAEAEFRKATKIDPKFRDAQFNLAQVPFKKKDYAKARDRFESLFSVTSGADGDQAAQLIKFKIFLTLLLEGKDARARKMMEQFQFTADTPALYYAQAAMEFQGKNPAKATEWVTSARKIYSPALNGVFAESLYDVGWLQSASVAAAASPAPALAEADQAEVAPSIEPTPLATAALAQNNPAAATDPLTEPANLAVPGMEATTSTDAPAASTVVPTDDTASAVAAASSPSVETPVASTASPAAAQPVIANAPDTEGTDADETATTAAVAATPPGTLLAPAQVREWSQTTFAERLREGNTLLVAGLLLAAVLLIGSVMIPQFVRLMKQSGSAGEAASSDSDFTSEESVAGLDQFVTPARLAGGPPQVSLHLRASEPALRRGAMPLSRAGRLGGGSGVETSTEGANSPAGDVVEDQPSTAIADDQVEEGVGEAVAVAAADEAMSTAPEAVMAPAAEETVSEQLEEVVPASFVPPVDIETADQNADSTSILSEELTTAEAADPAVEAAATERPATDIEQRPVVTMRDPEVATEEPAFVAAAEAEPEQAANVVEVAEVPPAGQTAPEVSMPVEMTPAPVASEPVVSEPVGQGQPVPYQSAVAAEAPTPEPAQPAAEPAPEVPAAPVPPVLAGIGALRHSVASSAATPRITINEPTAQQPTTPATMPPPTTPTPAPVIRTEPPTAAPQQPAPAMQSAPQQGVAMHTAVQLTFSFEIASLQLTPTFKMGALQLKPTSKIVTMRLAPSQNPQPAMNLQVTFEIADVQLNGNSIGVVRLTPSQQQRPGMTTTPSFNIAGLQLVSGSEAAPVQMTPSQQGQASVLVTAAFQIATVEFSPSFDIASIILNSSSRNVNVQLPGTGPSAIEGAPVFEIGSVQLGGNGELGMMQLNPQGSGAKRA